MKIAVFFFGRIKGYEDCTETVRQLINDYDPVFFASINDDTLTPYHQSFFDSCNIKKGQYNIEKTIVPDNLKDENMVVYPHGLIRLNSDGQEVLDFSLAGNKIIKYDGAKPYNIYSQFLHRFRCLQLITTYQNVHNIIFDLVVSFRADIRSEMPLKLYVPLKNTVYSPPITNFNEPLVKINDMCNYGDLETMTKFCCLFINLDYVYRLSSMYHPELMVYKYLHSIGVNMESFNYTCSLSDKRG
jgi:hypothetical protein